MDTIRISVYGEYFCSDDCYQDMTTCEDEPLFNYKTVNIADVPAGTNCANCNCCIKEKV